MLKETNNNHVIEAKTYVPYVHQEYQPYYCILCNTAITTSFGLANVGRHPHVTNICFEYSPIFYRKSINPDAALNC